VIAEVIATYGRHLLLRDAAGTLQKARPLGRTLEIVCGDQVQCEQQGEEILVSAVQPRTRLLRRSTLRGRAEPLVANLTQLAVVLAPVPAPDLFLLDRYLCAAECAGLHALIVLNKDDIPQAGSWREALTAHGALGYDVISVNASVIAEGIEPLELALRGHTTILVGQSGVGKSSLTRLVTDEAIDIAISGLMREEEGRHTTTASRLYNCRSGGRVIDSPGVRDFAPAIEDLQPASLGFREIAQLAPQCRFADCRHMQEPGCAVRGAVDENRVDARRYESYRRLRRLHEQLWEQRTERDRATRR
jgi:ribosome biogenesis GTPase / thiamine phosphate phosphatase